VQDQNASPTDDLDMTLTNEFGLRALNETFELAELGFDKRKRNRWTGRRDGWTGRILAGRIDGLPVRVFDYYQPVTTTTGADGSYSQSSHDESYSCALAEIPAGCPYTWFSRRSLLWLVNWVVRAFGRMPPAGSKSFQRTFEYRCKDDDFVRALLDPALESWMMSSKDDFPSGSDIEMRGPYLLMAVRRWRGKDERVRALHLLREFHARIPTAVWSSYARG